jgi:hypothetical protein
MDLDNGHEAMERSITRESNLSDKTRNVGWMGGTCSDKSKASKQNGLLGL